VPVAVGFSESLKSWPLPQSGEAGGAETEVERPSSLRARTPGVGVSDRRGTLLGFFIGIIPGSAHIISTFVAYAVERRVSRHPERFGKGAIEGVAGPESANNAASCGALVPMLALGVPTGPIPAVLLAALMVHGISPGPLFIKEQPGSSGA